MFKIFNEPRLLIFRCKIFGILIKFIVCLALASPHGRSIY